MQLCTLELYQSYEKNLVFEFRRTIPGAAVEVRFCASVISQPLRLYLLYSLLITVCYLPYNNLRSLYFRPQGYFE